MSFCIYEVLCMCACICVSKSHGCKLRDDAVFNMYPALLHWLPILLIQILQWQLACREKCLGQLPMSNHSASGENLNLKVKAFLKNWVFNLKIEMARIPTFPNDQTTRTQKGAFTNRSSGLGQRNQAYSKNPAQKLNFIQIVGTNISDCSFKKFCL